MKTITKITFSVTVLISCFAVIHLLQQGQSSSAMHTHLSGAYSTYSTSNIPVYKGSNSSAATSSSGQRYSSSIPAISLQSSNTLPLTGKGFGYSNADVSIYGGPVIQSSVDFKSSSPAQAVSQADYSFYAMGGLSSKASGSASANYGLASSLPKSGGFVTPLTGDGTGTSPDPDNEIPETIPGTLPVGNGVWVLLFLAVGYVGMKRLSLFGR